MSLEANDIELSRILEPPGLAAWMGYDDLGRNISHRLVVGAQISLSVATVVTAVSALLGAAVGLIAAWSPGWINIAVSHVIDMFLAFPGFLLAIALAGVLGPGLDNVVFALVAVGWVGFARLVRAQGLTIRTREHVEAARVLGTAPARIAGRHILPLLTAPLIVEASFTFAAAIVAEAGLSFLGIGVQAPTPSWGSMIRDGVSYMLVAPHVVVGPGIAIVSTVLAVNLLGDALRDHMDIRLTRKRSSYSPILQAR